MKTWIGGGGGRVAFGFDPSSASATAVLSEGNARVDVAAANAGGAIVPLALVGKRYFEFEIVSAIVAGGAGRDGTLVGIVEDAAISSSTLGTITGYGYAANGKFNAGGSTIATVSSYAAGDVVGIAVDRATNSVWVAVNGVWSGDPAAGTGAIYTSLPATKVLVPAAGKDAGTSADCAWRAKLATTVYTPPSGFSRML